MLFCINEHANFRCFNPKTKKKATFDVLEMSGDKQKKLFPMDKHSISGQLSVRNVDFSAAYETFLIFEKRGK